MLKIDKAILAVERSKALTMGNDIVQGLDRCATCEEVMTAQSHMVKISLAKNYSEIENHFAELQILASWHGIAY